MAEKRPLRGSATAGANWYYNNWDFNALGTIYRKQTGEDIFKSFEQHIAGPIGMEDFSASRGRYVTENVSIHQAYPFFLSTRDLARFGQLFLDGGKWRGQQVVPTAWVAASTKSYSDTDRSDRGYGYMWWTLKDARWGGGAYFAAGNYGQLLAVIPAKRLVVAQTVDRQQNPRGVRSSDFLKVLSLIVEAAP